MPDEKAPAFRATPKPYGYEVQNLTKRRIAVRCEFVAGPYGRHSQVTRLGPGDGEGVVMGVKATQLQCRLL